MKFCHKMYKLCMVLISACKCYNSETKWPRRSCHLWNVRDVNFSYSHFKNALYACTTNSCHTHTLCSRILWYVVDFCGVCVNCSNTIAEKSRTCGCMRSAGSFLELITHTTVNLCSYQVS